jgi:type IV secretory pathway protease TraF
VQGLILGILVMLAGLAIARLWLVTGLARTVRIDGPSMAPAWLGGHFRVLCGDCGLVFPCDAVHPPASGLATCPNCGFKDNPLRDKDLVPGEQVLVDRWPHMVRLPRRGEVVAAVDPANADELVVKRVAGLPGEWLAIRGGDLIANGNLVQKSLRELAAVRVLVHDSRFAPHQTVGLPDRWQSTQTGSGWHRAPGGYRYKLLGKADATTGGNTTGGKATGFDWLEYHHWLMFEAHSRTKLSSVLDTDSYNQADNRDRNAVPDVQLSCRMRALGQGRLALAASDRNRRFEAIFDLAKDRVQLLADGTEVASADMHHDWTHRGVRVEFGLCDQQVLLSVGGREIFQQRYEVASPRNAPKHPLAIGADDIMLDVAHLVVWRDLYYLDPQGTSKPWQADAPLGPQAFALFGDNTTVSTDSRVWTGGVSSEDILGLVYEPFWAPRSRANPR